MERIMVMTDVENNIHDTIEEEDTMARTRFALSCALRHIYFNDFGLDRTFIMKDLASLVIYYSDETTPPEIIAGYKKLNEWLTRLELIKQLQVGNGEAYLERMLAELNEINLVAMMRFVKTKATEAGDLTLEKIKGDNEKW